MRSERALEWHRNRCSSAVGISVQVAPEYALISIDAVRKDGLAAAARTRSWKIDRSLDFGTMGSRAVLEEVREAARLGTVDAVVVDTVLWPGDTVAGALQRLDGLLELGVVVLSLGESWCDGAFEQPLLRWVVDQLDREHRARIRSALAQVRAEGRRLGRPPVAIPAERVFELRRQGASIRAIARAVGLGVSTVQRFLKSNEETERHGRG